MFFSSQTMAMSIVLMPNGDFNGILKQNENLLDIKGFWSADVSDVVEISFIVSWEDKRKQSHLTAFAGSIYKDVNNTKRLEINWMSIGDDPQELSCESKTGRALLSEGGCRFADELELNDSNNPFANSEFALKQTVIHAAFVSRITGIDWNVIEISPKM